eukprot:gene26010-32531_t
MKTDKHFLEYQAKGDRKIGSVEAAEAAAHREKIIAAKDKKEKKERDA